MAGVRIIKGKEIEQNNCQITITVIGQYEEFSQVSPTLETFCLKDILSTYHHLFLSEISFFHIHWFFCKWNIIAVCFKRQKYFKHLEETVYNSIVFSLLLCFLLSDFLFSFSNRCLYSYSYYPNSPLWNLVSKCWFFFANKNIYVLYKQRGKIWQRNDQSIILMVGLLEQWET